MATVAPKAAASQILYAHGSTSEFYRNGPYGLEQGFTLLKRTQAGNGPLVLALGLRGSLIPEQMGSQILFRTRSGATALSYGQLSALDATGHRLPGHMQIRNRTLQLRIDDRDARYPLRIDPFIQQGEKLTGSGVIGIGSFGFSVALSADGNTALIGGPSDNSGVGAAWVFTRAGSTWTQEGEKLTAGGESGIGNFGSSVALSGDGNTSLIGGSHDNSGVGAAWVFTRSGSTWTQQGGKLTGSGASGIIDFGISVALSGDANTGLIGGRVNKSDVVATWVFTRSGSTWTQQGGRLKGRDESGEGPFPPSGALSGDGNTALIGGGVKRGVDVGAAWVFTRAGSTWTQQGEKLTGAGRTGIATFGFSVALSGDGNTALIGGPSDNSDVGAAWVFRRARSTWTQQGAKLTAADESGKGQFGRSAALSSDGNTALIGGFSDAGYVGAGWVLTRAGSTWTQQGTKLTGSSEARIFDFGTSVALSGDANTALIGGLTPSLFVGAAWVFVRTEGPPPFPPTLTNLSETAKTWRESDALARIGAAEKNKRKKLPLGTTFSFSLNVAASVAFTFTEPAGGRRVGKTCVAPTRKNTKMHGCARTVVAGTLTFSARAGTNKVHFEGRLSKHRKLAPGSYTLVATATASGEHSTPRTLHFTIVNR
jgi:hypothetical protein